MLGYRDWVDRRQGRLATRALTWGGLVDHFVGTYAKPRRAAEGHELSRALQYRYDKIKEWVGVDRPVADLNIQDALGFLTALKRRNASKPYIRSFYGSFLAIINKAIEWEILKEPPFNTRSKAIRELVPRASDIEHRDRRLRPGEEEKLFAYLDARAGKSDRMGLVGDCSRFVLSLGWRRGTLRRLQFEDLQWDEGPLGTFRVPGSKMKGRRPSVKSLTPETRKIVERRREVFVRLGVYGPECYVFGKTTKQGNKGRPVVFGSAYNENDFITSGWRTARKRAGLDCTKGQALHFHDLRAEAACRLYEATGGDARRVMHFLDHRSLDETQKYIDRLMAHTERENVDIMATFERAMAPTTNATPQQAMVGGIFTAFPAKTAR